MFDDSDDDQWSSPYLSTQEFLEDSQAFDYNNSQSVLVRMFLDLHTSMVFEHTLQVELVIFAIIGLIYRLPLALLLTPLCNYHNCIKR